MSSFSFVKTRYFTPLFCTQFLGAFNDNLFKNALFVLISFHGLGVTPTLPPAQLVNIGALLFILPYFLFSTLAGEINTRFDKGLLARWIKLLEIMIMSLATWGFVTQSLPVLFFGIFLMGTQSTLFGPLKYAILPNYLKEKDLILGNGLIEGGTFLAILLGQAMGTYSVYQGMWTLSMLTLIVAVLGFASAYYMPRVPPSNPKQKLSLHIIRSTKELLTETLKHHHLRTTILGISWFWLIGAVYTTQLPAFVRMQIGGNEAVFNLLLGMFSIGIGFGSIICAKMSHQKLNLRLTIYGCWGMVVFGTLLGLVSIIPCGLLDNQQVGIYEFFHMVRAIPICLCIILIGVSGGFFSVPLYTWLQTDTSEEFRANAVAATNIANSLFMVVGSLFCTVVLLFTTNIAVLFLIIAYLNIYIIRILKRMSPDKFTRLTKKAG